MISSELTIVQGPSLRDIDVQHNDRDMALFAKRLLKIFRRDRLQDGERSRCEPLLIVTIPAEYSVVLPTLFSDINKRMDHWGETGQINPFKDVYDLVFQMTVRMATCEALATDTKTIKKISDLYWKLEKNATPVALLLPWFPSTAKKKKKQATKELYDMMSHYVQLRRKA